MAQFDVFPNPSVARDRAPHVVDIQSDLLDLSMRVVVPLIHAEYFRGRITRFNPVFEVENRGLVFSPAEMAGIPANTLKFPVTSLAVHRDDIFAALDMLLTGI